MTSPASDKDELEKLLTIRFGQLMIRSDSYPSVGELVGAAMPYIAQSNHQAVQKALQHIQAQGHGGGNWRRLILIELALAAVQARKDERGAE